MPEIPIVGGKPPAPDAGHVALGITNETLTTAIRMMLDLQAPVSSLAATDIINMLFEHIGKIMSLIEPEQLRNALIADIRRNLPGVVNRHVLARSVQQPGLVAPPPGIMVQ
jgi:hypothetical protein